MRKWSVRKIWIVLVMSNSPFSWLASNSFAFDCICGADLHHSGRVKFKGYPPSNHQRLDKLEAAVFGRAALRQKESENA